MSDSLDAAQEASRAQFDRQAGRYGSSHILSDTSDVEAALGGLSRGELDPALDVATGGGHTAVYLARRGVRVTASDLAPGMLAQGTALASSQGFTVNTALHTAEALPYADGTFGTVTCRVAAHHFSSVERFLSEAFRVLRPGGWLLVIDGGAPDGAPVAAAWLHEVEKLRDPSHGRFLASAEWSARARAAGFEVRRCEVQPFKQPDLEWYFETAATSETNRAAVRRLVLEAPDEVRRVLGLGEEDGRVVWWWPRVTLLGQRPEVAKSSPQT
jgi:SAM-dependent methyltransferase